MPPSKGPSEPSATSPPAGDPEESIREFARRDRDLPRRLKDEYWADRVRRLGAVEGLRAADDLRRQAALIRPGWPHEEDRARDLAAHVRLAEILRRAFPPGRG